MKILLSIWFFFITFQCFSHNLLMDCLPPRISQHSGRKTILQLNNLAKADLSTNPNQSIALANKALKIANQLKDYKAEGITYGILGTACFYQKHYKLADSYYDTALAIDEKLGNNKAIYNSLHNKVFLYSNSWINDTIKGPYIFKRYINLALRKKDYFNFNQALVGYVTTFHNPESKDSVLLNYLNQLYASQNKDNEILADILGCEGYLYRNNKMYSRSIKKYEQELMHFPDKEETKIIYFKNSGILYSELGMYKESLYYFIKARKLLGRQKSLYAKTGMFFLDASIGESYINLGDYKHALQYLTPALNNIHIFQPSDVASVYNNTGKAYTLSDSAQKAAHYLNEAFNIFDSLNIKEGKLSALNSLGHLFIRNNNKAKLSGIIHQVSVLLTQERDSSISRFYVAESYKLLSDYYAKEGNYKKSNESLEKGTAVYDSFLQDNNFILNELKTKYESAQRDEEVRIQKLSLKLSLKNKDTKKDYLIGSVVSLFLLLIVTVVFYRHRQGIYKLLAYPIPGLKRPDMVKENGNGPDKDRKTVPGGNDQELDDALRQHIMTILKDQLDKKVYLEPDLTLRKLAEKCKTNRTYLSRIIHETDKINFNNYINKYRIEEALRILSDPANNIPLKALPEKVGFKNYARFYEAFRKHTGVPPSVFIKNDTKL